MNTFDKLFNEIARMKNMEISVGIFGEETAEVAFYNEFGTKHIPARSFIRSTIAEHQKDIAEYYASSFQRTNDAKAAAALTSTYVENLIKAKIASGNFTSNAPSTVKKKGRNQPLIDTGRMINSVKGVVR